MNKNFMFLLFIVFMMSLTACAGQPTAIPENTQTTATQASIEQSKPEATPTEAVPYVQTVGSFLAINEVGLGPKGYVSLMNFTSVPTSTKGLYLCQGTECFALTDAVIEPGATGRVAVGDGNGLDGVIATHATIGELNPSDGELALFASEKYNDPKALLVYFQWGSTPHTLTQLAVDAGLWIMTSYAPTSENATRLYRLEESGWWLFSESTP